MSSDFGNSFIVSNPEKKLAYEQYMEKEFDINSFITEYKTKVDGKTFEQ